MKKVGILGGGQLGRMLLQASANYPVEIHILENDTHCPAAPYCRNFIKGDITNYEDVFQFGKNLDAITIEIEQVNTEALEALEKIGVHVYPKPSILTIIKNKINQKQFYAAHQIPTAPFIITETAAQIKNHPQLLPGVHKLALGGYDGRGVRIIQSDVDIETGFNEPSVFEKMVDIKNEIAQIIAIHPNGNYTLYPPVDMVFNSSLNLLSYQLCPASLPENVLQQIETIATKLTRALDSPGIFALELFVNKDDEVLVNEIAPRVHNSGHHTIEASYSSQFDMLLRIMLNYPLGNTTNRSASALINLVGEPGFTGTPIYRGIEKVLEMNNVFVHIYGKTITKPGRKMGHITVIENDIQTLKQKVELIKQTLLVQA